MGVASLAAGLAAAAAGALGAPMGLPLRVLAIFFGAGCCCIGCPWAPTLGAKESANAITARFANFFASLMVST
jgi:hypothetical protein